MTTLLTIATLVLTTLFVVGLVVSRDGLVDALRALRGRGPAITLGLLGLLLAGGLFARSFVTMDGETRERIVRGTEPGDSVSRGYDTKGRFAGMTQPLGRVFDRNGRLLAGYSLVDEHLGRIYPGGSSTVHVVGYWTGPLRDGVGVEKGLVYRGDSLRDGSLEDALLTIDIRLQSDALDALEGRTGAVVVYDPSNGEVLAAASLPTWEPESVLDGDAWRALVTDEARRPLVSRALRDRLSPGSSIKPIVAAAALAGDVPLPETEKFVCTGSWTPGPDLPPITCHGETHGAIGLDKAMAVSCNTYFASLAYDRVGFGGMKDFLERLGANGSLDWNARLPLNQRGALRMISSRVEAADDIARSRIGIGQASVELNPVHAAMIYGGIANGGRFMRPAIEVGLQPDTLDYVLPARVADELAKALRGPVRAGGTAAGIFSSLERRGIIVYGKTGTADREPSGRSPSWFSSFAEKGDRRYVVVVALEDRRGATAGRINAPIARRMIDALDRYGYFR